MSQDFGQTRVHRSRPADDAIPNLPDGLFYEPTVISGATNDMRRDAGRNIRPDAADRDI